MTKSSEASGFYKREPSERLAFVKNFANLNEDEMKTISGYGALGKETANRMIENVVGTFPLPLGFAPNFKINEKDYIVPMAVDEPVMIGQIQLVNLKDPFKAKDEILNKKNEIIDLANEQDPILVKFGGGCKDIEVRVLDSKTGPMVITHLLVDLLLFCGGGVVTPTVGLKRGGSGGGALLPAEGLATRGGGGGGGSRCRVTTSADFKQFNMCWRFIRRTAVRDAGLAATVAVAILTVPRTQL